MSHTSDTKACINVRTILNILDRIVHINHLCSEALLKGANLETSVTIIKEISLDYAHKTLFYQQG